MRNACTIVFIVPCDGKQANCTNTLLIIIILSNLFSKGISSHHATWSPSQKPSQIPTSSPLKSPSPSQFPTFEPSNHPTFEPTIQETNAISFTNLNYQPSQAPILSPLHHQTYEPTDTQILTSASSYTPTNGDELMLSMSYTFLTITLGSIIILFY